mmetsp:Transcript_13666/g.26232  ORF Transcript_13666/g.26232 Transcript_13666/m.26232 type:complete len:331 (-) Transcript_13666:196-1188(-)
MAMQATTIISNAERMCTVAFAASTLAASGSTLFARPARGFCSGNVNKAYWKPQAARQNARRKQQHGCVCATKKFVDNLFDDSKNDLKEEESTSTEIAPGSAAYVMKQREYLKNVQQDLSDAVFREDYKEAARLRDEVTRLELEDPIISRTQRLTVSLDLENYTEAAVLRDELAELKAKLTPKVPCFSDTVTEGIRVRVRSVYVEDRSDPAQGYYFFAYRITIKNESDRTVQLMSRHWTITDKSGKTETVNGPGVVGEQPVLSPGNEFEYTSACPLHTEHGTMEGSYDMLCVDDPNQSVFSARVGRFGLDEFNCEVPVLATKPVELPNLSQ